MSQCKLLASIKFCSKSFQCRHYILEPVPCLFHLGQCWPTIIGTTCPQWPLYCYSCTDVQTQTTELKVTCTWRCGHEPTWITYFKGFKGLVQDCMERHWKKHPKRTLMQAPKPPFKPPSLWLSISLGVIWTCQIIYNSLLGPRPSDLFFWSHGELGFWPAKKSNPARLSSSQTPPGCAGLDIDISLTLNFPLQHELLITWSPSVISHVMKEQRFCLNTLSRTDCFLWIKLLICVYVCACICRT